MDLIFVLIPFLGMPVLAIAFIGKLRSLNKLHEYLVSSNIELWGKSYNGVFGMLTDGVFLSSVSDKRKINEFNNPELKAMLFQAKRMIWVEIIIFLVIAASVVFYKFYQVSS